MSSRPTLSTSSFAASARASLHRVLGNVAAVAAFSKSRRDAADSLVERMREATDEFSLFFTHRAPLLLDTRLWDMASIHRRGRARPWLELGLRALPRQTFHFLVSDRTRETVDGGDFPVRRAVPSSWLLFPSDRAPMNPNGNRDSRFSPPACLGILKSEDRVFHDHRDPEHRRGVDRLDVALSEGARLFHDLFQAQHGELAKSFDVVVGRGPVLFQRPSDGLFEMSIRDLEDDRIRRLRLEALSSALSDSGVDVEGTIHDAAVIFRRASGGNIDSLEASRLLEVRGVNALRSRFLPEDFGPSQVHNTLGILEQVVCLREPDRDPPITRVLFEARLASAIPRRDRFISSARKPSEPSVDDIGEEGRDILLLARDKSYYEAKGVDLRAVLAEAQSCSKRGIADKQTARNLGRLGFESSQATLSERLARVRRMVSTPDPVTTFVERRFKSGKDPDRVVFDAHLERMRSAGAILGRFAAADFGGKSSRFYVFAHEAEARLRSGRDLDVLERELDVLGIPASPLGARGRVVALCDAAVIFNPDWRNSGGKVAKRIFATKEAPGRDP